MVVALATGIAANWSTIVAMFGSWVIVTAIIIVLVSSSVSHHWGWSSSVPSCTRIPSTLALLLRLRWSTSSFPSP